MSTYNRFEIMNNRISNFQFSIKHLLTHLGQIEFSVGFLDDGFNAWRQHFTWVAPSKTIIKEIACISHMNVRVEHPWAFAMALTLQKSQPQPVFCYFSPVRRNPPHFGFDKFSANLQLLLFAGCEPALDWTMESISLWRSWETCRCD